MIMKMGNAEERGATAVYYDAQEMAKGKIKRMRVVQVQYQKILVILIL